MYFSTGLFSTQCSFYAETRIIFGAVQFLCIDLDYFWHSAVFKQRLGLFSAVFMPRLGLFLAQCSFYAETRIIFDTVQFLC